LHRLDMVCSTVLNSKSCNVFSVIAIMLSGLCFKVTKVKSHIATENAIFGKIL